MSHRDGTGVRVGVSGRVRKMVVVVVGLLLAAACASANLLDEHRVAPYAALVESAGVMHTETVRVRAAEPGEPPIEMALHLYGVPGQPSDSPTLTATHFVVDGQTVPIPADPAASFDFSDADVSFETDNDITLHIEAYNVPIAWPVKVRVVPLSGTPLEVIADPLVGDEAYSTTSATFGMPLGFSAIQLRADAP